MESIRVENGVKIHLGLNAFLTIWEYSDGWNIEVSESEPLVRIGIRDSEGNIHFKYINQQ